MTNKSLVKYEEKDFDKYLNDKSVLELIDDLTFLEGIEPYAKLSHNGEIEKFLLKKHKDIPVHNVKEFNSFYESLNNKIAELADTNEGAKKYLENVSYQKELKELPNLMNKLEKMSLDELEAPFKAAIEYVYDAVIKQGFEMDYEDVTVRYESKKVAITIYKTHKTKFSLFKPKKGEELMLRLYSLAGERCDNGLDVNTFLRIFRREILETQDPSTLIKDMKTILSLPDIMNDSVKYKIKKLDNCMKKIKNDK